MDGGFTLRAYLEYALTNDIDRVDLLDRKDGLGISWCSFLQAGLDGTRDDTGRQQERDAARGRNVVPLSIETTPPFVGSLGTVSSRRMGPYDYHNVW